MATTRRNFLRRSALAVGGVTLAPVARRVGFDPILPPNIDQTQAITPLRILILGGTGFIGPTQVSYALSRGHRVTVFNRGQTHPGILPKQVEQLIGDRNNNLEALKNRTWDVVIDNPTTLPVWVRNVAQILKGRIGQYIFVSTSSVYAEMSWPGMGEDGPLAQYDGPDPMKVTVEQLRASTLPLYAPLKVIAEREVQKSFPGKFAIVRPGLIVGPGDESDRFTYWPARVARGGEVLAPGNSGKDTVQFIDVRDLGEWMIRLAEQKTTGVFNATGPGYKLTIGRMLEEIRIGTNSSAQLTWIDCDFLMSRGIHAWSDLPVWVASCGPERGFNGLSNKKALSKGITFRSVAETATATLAWLKSQPPERTARLRAGMSPEREAAVLEAWHARRK